MAEQLNIKITLADGTEQVFIAPKGNAYITKAIPKAKYQLIDPTTKRAPEVVKAKRVGKNLHIEVMEGEQPAFEIVLEAYADAEGALVTGQAADGMLYEYSAQVADAVQPVSTLAEGQDYLAGLGRFPVAESLEGVVALAPAVGLAPGAIAAIAGAGAALAGGGGGGGGGGAGSPSPNAVPADGAAVWKIIETAANSTRDGALKPTAEQYSTIGVKGMDTAAEVAMLGDIIDAQAWADVNTTAKVQALADAVAAVMTGAAGGTAPTLAQLQQMGMRGLTPDNLVVLQRAIEQTPDDGSALNTVGKLQALLNTINEATSAISAAAQSNNATELIPSAADYVNAGVSGVDAANLAAINSALDTDKIDGAATNTPAGIQAVVDAYQAIFNAADGQKDADAKPTAQQYATIGVTGLDASTPLTQLTLLGELIDGKSKADVDSVREVQDLADAVAAVMRGAAGGTPPTLDQLQKLGLTGLNPASLPELQKLIEQTPNDGTGVDTVSDLQKLLDDANKTLATPSGTGADLISGYAEANSATETTPAASVYRDAGVTGVSDGSTGNLASINSALNTLSVDRDAANTPSEIQTIVNAYQAILEAADGRRDGDAKPTAAQYAAIGITDMGGNVPVAKLNLLGDVIDGKGRADVDSAREVQDLADAVAAVMTGAAGGTAPTLEQLKKLGITGLTPANLAQVQDAIKQTPDDGSGVETVAKLQNLVSAFNNAVDVISAAAQANSATETKPGISDYAAAGVSGVDASNLAAVNSALNSSPVDAAATDTRPEIQTLVNAYQAILNAADGQRDGDTKPTAQQYASIGVTGLTAGTPLVQLALLGDVIDGKAKADVDSVREVQELADAVAAVMKGAAGGTAPTLDDLSKLGLTGLSPAALSELQKLIEQTPNDGTGVDTVKKLQDLVTQANAKLPVPTGTGTTLISGYAEANSATETTPALSAYTAAGVTGVSEGGSGNLASINSALNTASVNGAAVDTAAKIQAVVDSYQAILGAADGVDNKSATNPTATNPSATDYKNIGVSGFDAPTDAATIAKASLLGDAIDLKAKADVDTVPEIQELANAAAAVIAAAGTGPAPTIDDLQKLGITGVNPGNIEQIGKLIKDSTDDGKGVDTLDEIQALVDKVNSGLDAIKAAAQSNSATETSPTAADYINAGVSGVDAGNLAAINSALNTQGVDGAAVDTTGEIQAVVDAYQAILNAADGTRDSDAKPTAQQYAAIGVVGIDTPSELSLLGDVIDAKAKGDVDSVPEVQALADAVAAVMKGAAGGTAPTLEQLQELGLTGLNPAALPELQKLIEKTTDDGSAVDTVKEIQDLLNSANALLPTPTGTGVTSISAYAEANSATETTPALGAYTTAGVSGVDAGNLLSINSALNTKPVDGDATNTTAEIQTVVDSYQAILGAADGVDNKTTATNPSATDYKNIGVSGFDAPTDAATIAKASLLGDAIDLKAKADVDTVPEIQELANAAAAVIAAAGTGPAPTIDDLQKLGITGVNPGNIDQIVKAIKDTTDDGKGVNTLDKVQTLVDTINSGLDAIKAAAQSNSATETSPTAADYINAGVSGVDAGNLASINSALNTQGVDGQAVDTTGEIQAVVDAYQAILNAADGQRDADAKPTAQQYAAIGVVGMDTPSELGLLGDVIDAKGKGDVDTVPEVQALADAVAAVMKGAAGGTAPTLEQLQELGLTGVNPGNLKKVQDAIAGTADDGTGVDTVGELQKLIDPLVPTPIVDTAATTPAQALSAIKDAAENNSATETSPDAATYGKAGASGVTSANLASVNSALNTVSVNGAAVDTAAKIQAVVDSYQAILGAADGVDNKTTATNPGATDYKNIGVSGFDAPTDAATIAKASLLGDAIDLKAKADVDTVPEIQELANAAAAVIAAAGTGPAPTIDDLQKLGITGVNPGNIDQIVKAIKDTTDDGKGVDTLDEIQDLVDTINSGLDDIKAAAQSNSATETSPTAADYINAGVSGVDAGNLAAINSALNTQGVDGAAVDTRDEIQAVVDAYQAILNAADGSRDSDAKPTAQQYAAIGVVGMDTPSELSLLGDVIDAKAKGDVDSVPEVQALADAVAAVMKGAAGGTAPTLEQLQELGLTGLNPAALPELQKLIEKTADGGGEVDTVKEIQDLLNSANALLPTPTGTGVTLISAYAEANSATETTPALSAYTAAGVTGVSDGSTGNLASINSALNTKPVDGDATNTTAEIQTMVNSYQAILNAANGIDDKTTATNPGATDYKNIGVSGFEAPTDAATIAKASLLGDAIDLKAKADVDTVPEIQELANAAAAVIAAAGTGPAPTIDDLQKLGITGVNPGNIEQIGKLIKDSTDDGKGVDTLRELQALVPGSDITAPTATLAAGTSPNTGSAVAQSSEPGTAFLVKTGGTGAVVVTELANIQAAGDTKWNSVPISKAGTDTPLPLTGLEDGTYSLYTIDAAGNLSAAAAKTYTVDGTPPAAPALSLGTGVADGATAAEATQSTGAVQVTAEKDAAVSVTFTNGSKSVTKPLTGTGNAQAVVLSPQDLATLGDGTITVSASQTDAAGNAQTAAPATASFRLDTDAPAATLLTTGSGPNTGSVQVKSDEPGTAYLIKSDLVSGTPSTLSDLANILTPSLDVNWNSVALSAADSNTNLPLTGLADGSYSLYTADAAGNLSPVASNTYVVGVTQPATTAAVTGITDDVGIITGNVATGGVTDDTSLSISGTLGGATAGASLASGETVRIYDGSTYLGNATVTVNAGGQSTWSYTDTRTLTNNQAPSYTARVSDAAGNQSAAGTAYTATVDTQAPSTTAAVTGITDDVGIITGNVATGGVTDDTSLSISGTLGGATAGASLASGETVRIYDGSTYLGNATVTVNAGGQSTWSYTDTRTLTNNQAPSYTARVSDAAGNQSAAGTAYTATVDTQAPSTTAAVTGITDDVGIITGNVATGGVTDDTSLSISGTLGGATAGASLASGETVRIYDGSTYLGNATVTVNAGGQSTWSYTDTRTLTNNQTPSYTARVSDAAGNQSEAGTAYTATVDTQAPSTTAAVTGITDDVGIITGNVATGGVTDDTSLSISGTLGGATAGASLASGETVRIYDAGTYLGNATVTVNAGGQSTWSYTDTRTLTNNQTPSYTARVSDAAGNQSAAGTAYTATVDTQAPSTTAAVTGITDDVGIITGNVATGGVTDDTSLSISGTLGGATAGASLASGETVRIYDAGTYLGNATVTVNAGGQSTWSYTDTRTLTNNQTPSYTARVSDAAGNQSAAGTAYTATVDTQAPSTTAAVTGITDDVGIITGNVATGGVTDDTSLSISGTLGGATAGASLASGETVRIYDGSTYLGNATVTVNAGGQSTWSYTDTRTLTNNQTPSYTARVSDAAGNQSEAGTAYTATVDTQAPSTTAAVTGITDDVGIITGNVATGGVTDDTSLSISGTLGGATAGASLASGETVRIYDAGTYLGNATVTVNAGGQSTWSYTDTRTLTNNQTPSYTARVSDAAGNQSAAGTAYTATVDTQAPSTTAAVTGITDDVGIITGNVATGGVTDDTSLSISGTLGGATAGASLASGETVRIYDGSTYLGNATVTVNAGGQSTWSYTDTRTLTNNQTPSYTARVSDAAGNQSEAGTAYTATVDTQAPSTTAAVTGITDDVGIITGNVATGGVTDDTSLSISGTLGGATAGASLASGETVRIYDGSTYLGNATVTVNAGGQSTWSYTDTRTLTNNQTPSYTARVSDAAGNQSEAGTAYTATVDTQAPSTTAAVTGITDDVGIITGNVATGGVTDDTSLSISGTLGGATAGASLASGETVRIYDAGTYLGNATVTVNAGGQSTWSYTDTRTLTNNQTPSYTARVSDAAGNQSEAGTAYTATVDTQAPTTTLTAATGPNTGDATVKSSEVGTAYLVKTGGTGAVTVSDLASITNADGAKWNSLSIDQSKANINTNLSLSGLEDGTYSLYAVDAAGNLSQAAADSYTVGPAADTTAPKISSVQIESASVTDGGNSKVIDGGDTIRFSITMTEDVEVSNPSGLRLGFKMGNIVSGVGTTVDRFATYSEVIGNKIFFNYTVDARDLDINGISINASNTTNYGLVLGSASIKDLANNAASGTGSTGNLYYAAKTDNTEYRVNAISLGGSNGYLIYGSQAEGNWYYAWDRSGDGTISFTDTNDAFNKPPPYTGFDNVKYTDVSALNNTSASATVAGADYTYQLVLPRLGNPSDQLLDPDGFAREYTNTSVSSGSANNTSYDGLLALWDANNGTSGKSGIPYGWSNREDARYFSSDAMDNGGSKVGHAVIGLTYGVAHIGYDNGYYYDSINGFGIDTSNRSLATFQVI